MRWLVPRKTNIFALVLIFVLSTLDDASMGACSQIGVSLTTGILVDFRHAMLLL